MMPSPCHGLSPGPQDADRKLAGLEFDASERLRLMQSGLPLCIFLESSEVVALKPPSPLYIFVPRVSYLPTLIDRCHEHFKPYIQPSFGRPTSPFFDFGGIPIDWRIPVGVAFDIVSSLRGGRVKKRWGGSAPDCGQQNAELSELASCGCDVQLPWCLTVHFHGSASSYLSGSASRLFEFQEFWGWASFESFFVNSLKQATYIINGSATPFQRLAKAAEMQLLTASRTGSIAQFLEGCNELLPAICPRQFKRIPVRLYICGPPCIQLSLSFPCFKSNKTWCGEKVHDNSSLSSGTEYWGGCCEDRSQTDDTSGSPMNTNTVYRKILESEAQSPSTLGDLVHHVLPQLFPKLGPLQESLADKQRIANAHSAAHEGSGTERGSKAQIAQTANVTLEPGCAIGKRQCCVIVHGIQPLLQTPLFWLAATAPQLDMFLHVVVLVDEALMGSA